MKVKALRTIAGSYGVIVEGEDGVVSDHIGKTLVDAGLALEVCDEQPEQKEDEPAKPSVRVTGSKGKVNE